MIQNRNKSSFVLRNIRIIIIIIHDGMDSTHNSYSCRFVFFFKKSQHCPKCYFPNGIHLRMFGTVTYKPIDFTLSQASMCFPCNLIITESSGGGEMHTLEPVAQISQRSDVCGLSLNEYRYCRMKHGM